MNEGGFTIVKKHSTTGASSFEAVQLRQVRQLSRFRQLSQFTQFTQLTQFSSVQSAGSAQFSRSAAVQSVSVQPVRPFRGQRYYGPAETVLEVRAIQ